MYIHLLTSSCMLLFKMFCLFKRYEGCCLFTSPNLCFGYNRINLTWDCKNYTRKRIAIKVDGALQVTSNLNKSLELSIVC